MLCLLILALTSSTRFGGNAAPNTSIPDSNDQSYLEQFKFGVAVTFKSLLIDNWLATHTPETVIPRLHKVIEAAKDEFADAIANGGGIYAVGYCFGAKYVLLLGGEHDDGELFGQTTPKSDEEDQAVPAKRTPIIKVGAIAHGTQVTPDDLGNVKVPMSLICVENDQLFPDEVRLAGVEALEKAQIEHEVKVYPEVPHGFAVFGDYEEPKIKEAQQTAFAQMLGWLQAH
jgi:dienelactone hydrolase